MANPFGSGGANNVSLYQNQKLFEEKSNNDLVKDYVKDKNWRKLTNADRKTYLAEDKWKSKPIFDLSEACWYKTKV